MATSPPSCSALATISREPKPRFPGGLTRGPSCSVQTSSTPGDCSGPAAVLVHVTATLPPGALSAPCLAALVASSCSTRQSVTAALGLIRTGGPALPIAAPRPPAPDA